MLISSKPQTVRQLVGTGRPSRNFYSCLSLIAQSQREKLTHKRCSIAARAVHAHTRGPGLHGQLRAEWCCIVHSAAWVQARARMLGAENVHTGERRHSLSGK
jgi:hypothetical protein